MSTFLIQLIGFVAVAFFIASYQLRSNRLLFIFQMLGCVLFTVQFFVMGAVTGALSLIIIIIRNVLMLNVDRWSWVKSKWTMSAILLLLAVSTAFTWAGPLSLLPCLSAGVTTVGYWTNNAQKIRLSQLIGAPQTLVYDIIVHSWGGVLSESITLVSIIVSIIRFGWNNMKEGGSEF